MRTYIAKLNGQEYTVKAQNENEAKAMIRALRRPLACQNTWKEITGTIGGEERTATLSALFGGAPVAPADPEGYRQDCEEFYRFLPAEITLENITPFLARATAIFEKHLPIQDLRKTPAEVKQQNDESARYEKEREDARAAWRAEHCEAEPIALPEGMMFVTLAYNYDDSDSQSDYFDRHCQWGEKMVIGIVKKGAQREAIARRVLANYPELAALEWTWNTENYSMGHGNYLQSGAVGIAEGVKTYGGYSDPAVHFEIQFNAWERGKIYPYKGYPGSAQKTNGSGPAPEEKRPAYSNPAAFSAPSPCNPGEAYTFTHRDGTTWVYFPGRPSFDVLNVMHIWKKNFGGKWNKQAGAWEFYAIIPVETIAAGLDPFLPRPPFVVSLLAGSEATPAPMASTDPANVIIDSVAQDAPTEDGPAVPESHPLALPRLLPESIPSPDPEPFQTAPALLCAGSMRTAAASDPDNLRAFFSIR